MDNPNVIDEGLPKMIYRSIKVFCRNCKKEVEPVNEMGDPYVSGNEYEICPMCLETLGKIL